MQLLERETTLATLAEYADDARRGEGRLVLVNGEAGVGKTALLELFERSTPDAVWAWGACDGLYTPRPLGPLFDLAHALGGDLREACRSGAAREDLFGALLRQVDVPGRLTVAVVEDIHWADEATLDMLRFLGRRLRDVSALVVATYRDDGLAADDPLRLVLGELVTLRAARRMGLPTLTREAVEEMARTSDVDPDTAFRLTGGNPFYVTQLIEAGCTTLPASARDAVLARVARLAPRARAVLEAAALVGARVEPGLLAAVAEDVDEGIDACTASGLLTYDDAGLRFRHEIIRMAVEDAVPGFRRARVHAVLLDALRAAGSPDQARLAYHAEGAADASAVLEHAPQAAGIAAAMGSHREAAAQYERALRFAGGAEAAFTADLYDGLAREAALIDSWQAAADARLAALSLWRQVGDRVREGDSLRMLSRAMWRLCRGADAVEAAERALEVLEPLPDCRELAWAFGNLAIQRTLSGERDAAIVLATRAQDLAVRLSEPAVLSDALNTAACAAAGGGGPWLGQLRHALEVALAADAQEQAGRAYANLYAIGCGHRLFADVEADFVDGLAYCDSHDITTFSTCLRGQRTSHLEQTGDWSDAVTLGRRMLKRRDTSPVNRLNPLISVGKILARRGEPDAWPLLTEAAESAAGTAEPEWVALASMALAEAEWLDGQPERAARTIESATEAAHRRDAWTRGAVEVWRRRLGLPAQYSDDVAPPYAAQLAGDLRGASEAWTALGCPFEAAMALVDSTDEDDLRGALSRFDELGAVSTALLTRRTMRRLGLKAVPTGPRAATREHQFRLTRREHEVLDLLCEGMANTEISERLFISERTVDHHVSAVLGKMNVRSRAAAAREAIRAGIVGSASTT